MAIFSTGLQPRWHFLPRRTRAIDEITTPAISLAMLLIIAQETNTWIEAGLGLVVICFFAIMLIGALTGFK